MTEVIKHTTSAPMSLVEHWDDSTKLHLRLPSASVLGASLMLFKVRVLCATRGRADSLVMKGAGQHATALAGGPGECACLFLMLLAAYA